MRVLYRRSGHRAPRTDTESKLKHILNLEDFEAAVRRRLPHAVYGYVAHGSETETSLRTNRAAFDHWRFVTRNLVGVSERAQKVTLFGREYGAPFGIAPMGGSGLVAYDGHTVMARAAAGANIPFILSANSIEPLEEMARANPNTWFAAYQSPNRQAIEGMVARVARAGIAVLVLTTDVPIGSNREADARAGFSFPIRPNVRLSWDVATHPRPWAHVVEARHSAHRQSGAERRAKPVLFQGEGHCSARKPVMGACAADA